MAGRRACPNADLCADVLLIGCEILRLGSRETNLIISQSRLATIVSRSGKCLKMRPVTDLESTDHGPCGMRISAD